MEAYGVLAASNLNSLILFTVFLFVMEESLDRYGSSLDAVMDPSDRTALSITVQFCMGVVMVILVLRVLLLFHDATH